MYSPNYSKNLSHVIHPWFAFWSHISYSCSAGLLDCHQHTALNAQSQAFNKRRHKSVTFKGTANSSWLQNGTAPRIPHDATLENSSNHAVRQKENSPFTYDNRNYRLLTLICSKFWGLWQVMAWTPYSQFSRKGARWDVVVKPWHMNDVSDPRHP